MNVWALTDCITFPVSGRFEVETENANIELSIRLKRI
ncbi:hypothetical protein Cop2CBH44_27250 [Coprobacter secundus subsp. similis]|uniref:Uncharacterized protein n=1 Tax=Coprobacter secundus subsp. similis TaxID=2751153 RepID=A0A7G1HZW3_9BACT|nr:hypothetical protein Cop2CBH44_27250 [Coprobacter secundus subsp. similis]